MKLHIINSARQPSHLGTGVRFLTKTLIYAAGLCVLFSLPAASGIPADNVTVTTATAGSKHSLYLTSDGKLWMMGNYSDSPDMRSTPVQVADDVATLASGNEHSLFITKDGLLWAMGNNACGQLGDGTTTTRDTPVHVNTSGVSVKAVSAGNYHSLFVTSDGKLWAMGSNLFGALGDGTTTDRLTPVQVTGAADVVAVVAGDDHSLYITGNGDLWAMGANHYGQLGRGDIASETHVPVLVVRDGEAQSRGIKQSSMPIAFASEQSSNPDVKKAATTAPRITEQPENQTVIEGKTATFRISAGGAPNPTYQWYEQAGTSAWKAITNGGGYRGATSPMLTISNVPFSYATTYYYCRATNSAGYANSKTVWLRVTKDSGSGSNSGGTSGGGGGGAPSLWLLAAMGTLAALRVWKSRAAQTFLAKAE